VIFDAGGRVLLIKENYERRRWSLPGGRIEDGETPWEAAIREAQEETTVEVDVDHLIGVYGLATGFFVFGFAARIVRGEPAVPPTDEIADVVWWDARALPEPRSNILHYAVPDAVAGARGLVRTNLPRLG
jgi:ADP-ribose pyrophosphatase YjhB (NUDIX family)